MNSFKRSEKVQKKVGGPDCTVSNNQFSSVTLNELAMNARDTVANRNVLDLISFYLIIATNQKTTLFTPSFGNHLFANYHVLNHPLTNLILSSFYIPKVLKSAAKIMEIGSQIKNSRPKIISNRAFSIVKLLPREVTIFPQKNKISNFSF